MAFTAALAENVTVAGETISRTNNHSGGSLQAIDEAIAANLTDQLITFTLDYSEVALFYIVCDAEITIHTNTTVGVDTLVLVANEPYVWQTNSLHTFLIGTDITQLFVDTTNDPTTVRNLVIRAISDPYTPS